MIENSYTNLTEEDSRIAARIRKFLEEITPIQRMVVYGSQARNEAEFEANMDVFICGPRRGCPGTTGAKPFVQTLRNHLLFQ
jgi:predicted nucleotidyltransferase